MIAKSGSGDREITSIQRIVLRPIPYAPVRPPDYNSTFTLSPPFSLNGRLFVESRESIDLHEAAVTLLSVDPDFPPPRSAPARPEGQFTLNGVVPASYVLEISNLPQDLYLKAARFGADILDKPLTVDTRSAATPLQILLGSDGGRLRVAVYNGKGEPYSGAQVVLVPDAVRRHRREQYRVTTSGEDGRAILRGIPPGSYRLLAWEHIEANAYLNSDYLQAYESFGIPLMIASGENPAISVRLIPKE